jgi:hypothetical protein
MARKTTQEERELLDAIGTTLWNATPHSRNGLIPPKIVEDIDDTESGFGRDTVVIVMKDGRKYTVSILPLNF